MIRLLLLVVLLTGCATRAEIDPATGRVTIESLPATASASASAQANQPSSPTPAPVDHALSALPAFDAWLRDLARALDRDPRIARDRIAAMLRKLGAALRSTGKKTDGSDPLSAAERVSGTLSNAERALQELDR